MSDFKLDFRAPPSVREPTRPSIRFRHIALLLLGSAAVGYSLEFLTGRLLNQATISDFTKFAVLGFSFYGSLVVGYHWISQEQKWIGLRARFAPVRRRVLMFSAIAAIALVGLIVLTSALLKWAGVTVRDMPSQVPQFSWAESPIALVLICMLAPVAEELLFRGLLLDWLRQKLNGWIAAVILSLLFSLLHRPAFASGAIGWLTFTEAFLLGLAASALAIKYHSLRPALAMHATLNVIGYIASVVNYR